MLDPRSALRVLRIQYGNDKTRGVSIHRCGADIMGGGTVRDDRDAPLFKWWECIHAPVGPGLP